MAIKMSQLSALAVAIAVCLFAAMAYGQVDDKPLNENWAPTEWGRTTRTAPPIARRRTLC